LIPFVSINLCEYESSKTSISLDISTSEHPVVERRKKKEGEDYE
jgi:hypothetical protein